MARKKSKEELNLDNVELDENGEPVESKGSKLTSFLVGLVVVIIWLVIFALLIKMDVGGVGTMLRPYLKNVPVINQILPDASSEEIADETGYKFNSIAEAVERIKELESQLSAYQNSGDASAQQIADLQAEVDRLKVFEENQEYYEQLRMSSTGKLSLRIMRLIFQNIKNGMNLLMRIMQPHCMQKS